LLLFYSDLAAKVGLEAEDHVASLASAFSLKVVEKLSVQRGRGGNIPDDLYERIQFYKNHHTLSLYVIKSS
jgi:hypothetical protein